MTLFLQNLVNGLSAGAIYALLAVGLVLLFRTSRVVNFAHGSFAMLSTFVAFELHRRGAPLVLAFLGSIAFAFALGAGAYMAVVRRARAGGHHGELLVTIALYMVVEGVAGAFWGSETRSFHHYFANADTLELAPGLHLSLHHAWINGITLATVLLLATFFARTKTGLALRAVSEDEAAARLMGVPVERMHLFVWGLSTSLGALAGILLVPQVLLDPPMMFAPLLKAFAAAVLGGMTSMVGAVIGGWALGVIETLAGAYVSTELQSTLAFGIIVLVLALRPEGLLSARRVEKV